MEMIDENVRKAGTEGFNLPHDIVKLPTQGVFYKSKKSSIKVGYLTATDENYLMSRDMDSVFIKLYGILNYETIQKYSATDIYTYDEYDFLETESCCVFCYIGFDKKNFYRDHNIN